MISNANRPAPSRGNDFSPRRRVAIGMLACAALAAAACAKGGDASADSAAATTPAPAADSASMAPAAPAPSTAPADSTKPSPISADGAEKQATAAATTPAQAKRLDEATRAVARQGAATRDTAHTGAVTAPPTVRKTATTKSATTPPANVSATTAQAPAAPRDTNPPTSGAGQQAASAQDDHLTASPAAYQGWKTFHVYCYRCHGVDAMGSDLAPNLRHSVGPEGSVTHEVFVTTVKEGRLPKGMPSWKALLDDQQIENLWAYLKARSSGQLAPGRPRQAKSD